MTCRDVARDREVWNRSYPQGVRSEPIDDEELAVLDPSGRMDAVRLADGAAVTMETRLGSGVETFLPLRSADRYLVFTQVRPSTAGPTVQGNPAHAHVDGPAFAFSRQDGRLMWTRSVERQQFDVDQPLGLPFVLFAAELRTPDGSGHHELKAIDIRTGETLLEQRRLRRFGPFRSEATETGHASVVLPGARIAVAPADEH